MAGEMNVVPRPARDSFELGHRARRAIAGHFETLRERGWALEGRTGSLEGAPDLEGHWYEYVPSGYEAGAEVPLVVSLHAGHYYAAAQVYDTCWCEIAEREGFIVVFPEAISHGCFGDSGESAKLDPHQADVRFLMALLEDLQKRFSIDSSRIYLHGMSRGGVFAAECALLFGSKFAALGTSCGALLLDAGSLPEQLADAMPEPMPVIQMQSAFDTTAPCRGVGLPELLVRNRHFWMELDGCTGIPDLAIGSRELVAYYHGSKADYVVRENAFHNHYEAISDAEDCWSLFAGARRLPGGEAQCADCSRDFEPDRNAIAVGDMSSHALVDGELVSIGAMVRQYRDVNVRRRGGFQSPQWAESVEHELDGKDMHVYYYVPVAFVARLFGLRARIRGDRASITTPDGAEVDFASGSSAAVLGGRVRNMGQSARLLAGELCIPLDWFAERIMGLCTAASDGILYIADHQVVLTSTFAGIIREIIGWGE